MVSAQVKMKALVISRLLMGDISNWTVFDRERQAAGQIANRRAARSVASQIGRSYSGLSTEIKKFIEANFVNCGYDELASLCDEVRVGAGIFLRLDEFEKNYFYLSNSVKNRFPYYAHVHVSPYGLQFEWLVAISSG
jgi:hypothetical protein